MIKTLILNAYKANIEQLTGPDKLPEGIARNGLLVHQGYCKRKGTKVFLNSTTKFHT